MLNKEVVSIGFFRFDTTFFLIYIVFELIM